MDGRERVGFAGAALVHEHDVAMAPVFPHLGRVERGHVRGGGAGSAGQVKDRFSRAGRVQRGQHDDIQIDRPAGAGLAIFKDGEFAFPHFLVDSGELG